MHPWPLLSLLIIGVVWLRAWALGIRWCRGWGVTESVSRLALAAMLPAAGLVFSIHLLGCVTLFAPVAIVRPEPAALIFLILVWFLDRRTRHLKEATTPPEPRFQETANSAPLGWWLVPLIITAALYVVFALEAFTRFPTGYDGLNYHLPLAIHWMRAERLDLTPGMLYESLPDNGLMIPFLFSFVAAEKLITVCRIPDALLVAAAVYGLTRAVGVSRLGSLLSTCVAMSIPMVIFQSTSTYIDLYGASCWLGGLLALTWASRAPDIRARRGLLTIAGLAAGLALGAKSTYLLLVAPFIPIVLALDWLHPFQSRVARHASFKYLVRFAGFSLTCSSFWFARGAVQAGNPVYPFEVKVAGHVFLHGFDAADHVPRHSWTQKFNRWWDYPWRESNYTGTGYPYSVSNSLGATYAAFVPVGLVLAVATWFRKPPRNQAQRWRVVYLLIILAGGLIFLTAFTEVLRYVLPIVLISVAVAAVQLDRFVHLYPRSTGVVLTLSLIVTASAAAIEPVRSFAGRWKDHRWDRAWFYQVPPLVDQLEPGVRIVNLGTPPLNYALLGAGYRNVVIPLTHWVHLTGSNQATADQLRRHKVDYLWARAPWREGWSEDLPVVKIFDDVASRALASTPATRVYRVVGLSEFARTSVAEVRTD